MNLGTGGDLAFDGPALLILADGEAPEDADAMIESNALQLGAESIVLCVPATL